MTASALKPGILNEPELATPLVTVVAAPSQPQLSTFFHAALEGTDIP